jgi:hypothetical protein
MSDISRGERLQVMLTDEELKALDDWRFSRRMPSRASATVMGRAEYAWHEPRQARVQQDRLNFRA